MLAHEEIAKGWNVDVGDIAKRGLFLIGSADEIRGQLEAMDRDWNKLFRDLRIEP